MNGIKERATGKLSIKKEERDGYKKAYFTT
jgi:hypothetical protein